MNYDHEPDLPYVLIVVAIVLTLILAPLLVACGGGDPLPDEREQISDPPRAPVVL